MKYIRRNRIARISAVLFFLLIAYVVVVELLPLSAPQIITSTKLVQFVTSDVSQITKQVQAGTGGNGVALLDKQHVTDIHNSVVVRDDEQYSIASITKIITVLTCADKLPLNAGDSGPQYTLTDADSEITKVEAAKDSTTAGVPSNTRLSQRDMLELILLKSAGDTAIQYAHWAYGDDKRFLEAADKWLKNHGLTHTKIVEPTGVDPENKSTLRDVLEISRLAMENPIIAEIVKLPEVDIPGYGKVENSNPLVASHGVVGLKTGTLYEDYLNLSAVKDVSVAGREIRIFVTTLGKKAPDARINDTVNLLDSAITSLNPKHILAPHAEIGSIVTVDGREVRMLSDNSQPVDVVLLPGETATLSIDYQLHPGNRTAGKVTLHTPAETKELPVVLVENLPEPDFWWRFGHPLQVFGLVSG